MKLEYDEIKQILPHRYPFLLVDRILEGEEGVYARGIKQISGNEAFFQGHFPGQAIFPGVLQLEALAQLGAAAFLSLPENRGKIALFAGVNKARFRGIVRPGDTLDMTTRFSGEKAGVGFAAAEARVNGEKVCSAELMFVLMDNKA